jgi:hypothetical protein
MTEERRSERPARLFAQVRSTAGLGVRCDSLGMKVGADETVTKVRRLYKGEFENPSFKFSPLAAKFDSKTAVQPQGFKRHFVAG